MFRGEDHAHKVLITDFYIVTDGTNHQLLLMETALRANGSCFPLTLPSISKPELRTVDMCIFTGEKKKVLQSLKVEGRLVQGVKATFGL